MCTSSICYCRSEMVLYQFELAKSPFEANCNYWKTNGNSSNFKEFRKYHFHVQLLLPILLSEIKSKEAETAGKRNSNVIRMKELFDVISSLWKNSYETRDAGVWINGGTNIYTFIVTAFKIQLISKECNQAKHPHMNICSPTILTFRRPCVKL